MCHISSSGSAAGGHQWHLFNVCNDDQTASCYDRSVIQMWRPYILSNTSEFVDVSLLKLRRPPSAHMFLP